jgi:hypothetical protein
MLRLKSPLRSRGGLRLLAGRRLAHAEHDVARLLARLDVAGRLDDLVERVPPVDHMVSGVRSCVATPPPRPTWRARLKDVCPDPKAVRSRHARSGRTSNGGAGATGLEPAILRRDRPSRRRRRATTKRPHLQGIFGSRFSQSRMAPPNVRHDRTARRVLSDALLWSDPGGGANVAGMLSLASMAPDGVSEIRKQTM